MTTPPSSTLKVHRSIDKQLSHDQLIQIYEIYHQIFMKDPPDPLQEANILRAMSQFNTFEYYWIEDPNPLKPKIVATGNYIRSYHWAHLFDLNTTIGENVGSIACLPEYRHRGYATAIVKAIIEDHGHKSSQSPSPPLILEIKADDPNYDQLLLWYKKLGFSQQLDSPLNNPNTYLKYTTTNL